MTKLYEMKALWPLWDFEPESLPFLGSVDPFGDGEVKYFADKQGVWLYVADAKNRGLDFEAVTGFSIAELEGKKIGDRYVYGINSGATPGQARPLLSFPFTDRELWEFDRRTGGLVYESIERDGDLKSGDKSETERWLNRLALTDQEAVELARALLSAEPPGIGPPSSPGARPTVVPVPRTAAHEAAILHTLRELRYDPSALPHAPGKTSSAKAEVRKALSNLTPAIFKKAWQSLRDSGQIDDA